VLAGNAGGAVTERCPVCGEAFARVRELEAELDDVCAQAATFRAERDLIRADLRSVARYADGLHFAGRLADEKLVRAALSSSNDVPVHPELEDGGLDLELLRKLAVEGGGRRTRALREAGLLTWQVTPAGHAALGSLNEPSTVQGEPKLGNES
jgi:hypothetical protein